jgi:hypothetical protein
MFNQEREIIQFNLDPKVIDLSFILFMTFHRIYLYLSWRKVLLIACILSFFYTVFPIYLFGIFVPVIIGALLLQTEQVLSKGRFTN